MEYLDGILPSYTISGFRSVAYGLVNYLIGVRGGNSGYDAKNARAAKTDKGAPQPFRPGEAGR